MEFLSIWFRRYSHDSGYLKTIDNKILQDSRLRGNDKSGAVQDSRLRGNDANQVVPAQAETLNRQRDIHYKISANSLGRRTVAFGGNDGRYLGAMVGPRHSGPGEITVVDIPFESSPDRCSDLIRNVICAQVAHGYNGVSAFPAVSTQGAMI